MHPGYRDVAVKRVANLSSPKKPDLVPKKPEKAR